MLDAKSLEVLQSLKSDIKAAKTILSGRIKGTGRSFGFVVEADGKEHFLPPDQMTKVFPGDDVTFTVTEQDDGKTRAELESLEASTFKTFNGVYYVRGKGQGVEPFNDAFSGWLFVPPKSSGGASHNDIVKAKVTRHPWKTGKAQAEIVASLGSADNNRSWYSMTLAEHGVPETFNDEEIRAAEQCADTINIICEHRTDLTDVPFVTIDSATTQDMDDALFASKTEAGWQLQVAIADASAFIEPDSILDQAAKLRLTTTYLPGLTLPMVPETLANNAMSLVENEVRPALVFKLLITPDGDVRQFSIEEAKIKSQGKLNYTDVAQWIENETFPPQYADNLMALAELTSVLSDWRSKNANKMQDRKDFRIKVDENFNVEAIQCEQKNNARALVEEAMVLTNVQTAKWLATTKALFMCHLGFKPDRETELKGLLRDYAADAAELDGSKLSKFRQILKAANQVDGFPLTQVLQKRFDRGFWSNEITEHFGLGVESYTNATSPIRKYTDLLVHRAIKQKLNQTEVNISNEMVADINERNFTSRQVANTIENRLKLKWLAEQATQTWDASVHHVNANGLIVQLEENGIVGFVDFRKKKDEFSYDPLRMMLKFEDHHFQLNQRLKVQIKKIENDGLTLALA